MNIRHLSAHDFAAVAPLRDGGVRGNVISGEVNAPAVEITGNFTYQSYFDDTLLQRAILAQPPSDAIVPSTLKSIDLAGYSLGLHPSSETPVTVRFRTGQQQGASSPYRLKPGQVIRPYGRPGDQGGQFSGFDFGIPFGWLGGGTVTLILFRTSDAWVDWPGSLNEYIYHRTRMRIVDSTLMPATPPYNWPMRFPWSQASFGASGLSQRGEPALVVTPTRTFVRLRVSSLAAPVTMRALFTGTNDFAMGPTGSIDLTDVASYDVIWGTWAQLGGGAGPGTQYQTQMLGADWERLSADNGGLILCSDDADLIDEYVDIVRYGRL